MVLRSAAASDLGRRRAANEDYFLLAPEIGLFAVADGLGGQAAGEVASKLAVEALARCVREPEGDPEPSADQLRRGVERAHREVVARAKRCDELRGMGTTLVALLVRADRATLAHVGDSRAYLFREGAARQLTDDHSVVGALLREQRISAAEALLHPQRHVLTRALGAEGQVVPELGEVTAAAGDVIVLCSDGLTSHVRDREIGEALAADPDLRTCVDALVALANDRGGRDNITVLAVRWEGYRRPGGAGAARAP